MGTAHACEIASTFSGVGGTPHLAMITVAIWSESVSAGRSSLRWTSLRMGMTLQAMEQFCGVSLHVRHATYADVRGANFRTECWLSDSFENCDRTFCKRAAEIRFRYRSRRPTMRASA